VASIMHGAFGGRDQSDFGQGSGIAEGRGDRGRVVKYYYIFSCTGSMFSDF